MSYNIFSSSSFEKSLKGLKKKHPSLRKDLLNLIELLKNDPITGTSIGKDWAIIPYEHVRNII